jgi:hypothetical protein
MGKIIHPKASSEKLTKLTDRRQATRLKVALFPFDFAQDTGSAGG